MLDRPALVVLTKLYQICFIYLKEVRLTIIGGRIHVSLPIFGCLGYLGFLFRFRGVSEVDPIWWKKTLTYWLWFDFILAVLSVPCCTLLIKLYQLINKTSGILPGSNIPTSSKSFTVGIGSVT